MKQKKHSTNFVDKSTKGQEDYKRMKRINEHEVVDCIMALMAFLWILAGACAIGLTLSIIKAILMAFGIENNI